MPFAINSAPIPSDPPISIRTCSALTAHRLALWGWLSLTLSLSEFLIRLSDPRLLLTVCLTMGVILVNGWTDAPNAITATVVTGALSFRSAVLMASVCNLLGVLCSAAVSNAVAQSIYDVADFGGDTRVALTALCAALTAILLWATVAWRFGIPTSESHALVAGLSGAALALEGGFYNLSPGVWMRILAGLFLSVLSGFLLGRWHMVRFGAAMEARLRPRPLRACQIAGSGVMAFFHGAQDGQKLIGVFLLSAALAQGRCDTETFPIPFWLMLLCAVTMALGTALGGKRIIDNVGRNMVSLTPVQGLSADLTGSACLLLCTLLGLPVSTTHTKTAAILGVGAASGKSKADWHVARSILLAWVFTFPGCGLIGYGMARLFLRIV